MNVCQNTRLKIRSLLRLLIIVILTDHDPYCYQIIRPSENSAQSAIIMGSRGALDDTRNKKIRRRGTLLTIPSVLLALTIVAASRVSLAASQGIYNMQQSHVHVIVRHSVMVVVVAILCM